MVRYFTHLWTNDTWEQNRAMHDGNPLDHTAGNLFRDRGVSQGDLVYVVTVMKGLLYLCGRMQVGRFLTQKEANEHFGENVWEARDHLLARDGTTTPERFDRNVPPALVHHLRFVTADGTSYLNFDDPIRLNQQTLRGVRQLTPDSAKLLDRFIEDNP